MGIYAGDSYEEMFDAELSTSSAKSQGIGITDWLVRQLENPEWLGRSTEGHGVVHINHSPLCAESRPR